MGYSKLVNKDLISWILFDISLNFILKINIWTKKPRSKQMALIHKCNRFFGLQLNNEVFRLKIINKFLVPSYEVSEKRQ